MKPRLALVPLLLFSLAAAGCNSADSVLNGFTKALRSGNRARFSKLLARDALEKYGTPEGFEGLRAKLAPLRLKTGRATLIDYQCYATQFLCRDHLVTYTVPLLAAPVAAPKPHYDEINTATLVCIEVDHGIAQVNMNCVFTAFAKEF